MKVEIEESKLQTAYANACDGVKDFMESLFGKKVFEAAKPTLDDYKTIRTYEDACEALGETPILSENRKKVLCAKFPDHYDFRQNMPNHIIALMKLETISQALWGKNYQPKPDASGSRRFYFPWFALWTEREIKETEGLVYIPVIDAINNHAGFGYARTDNAPSDANAAVGSRLWQESREKAKYFGQQFIELWFDYLMFNVKKVQE